MVTIWDPEDPRLGRRPEFDERSRQYPVRPLLADARQPVRRTWRCDARLDQGATPHCVGFAWTHDHGAEPIRRKVADGIAHDWYRVAQAHDQWPGEDYDGSSTLGGAKAGVWFGAFNEYRWCFSLMDYILTLGWLGPVIVGTNWYRSMFSPDPSGHVTVDGRVSGGHEWMLRGVNPDREVFIARNSWGRSWGHEGDFTISFEDFDRLRLEDGDGAYPVR
jgi:hypothetical protein